MTTRSSWLDVGVDLLAAEGFAELTIDVLCARRGLSKGSFYHHFRSMPTYRAALLDYVEDAQTRAFAERVGSAPPAAGADRLQTALEVVAPGPGRCADLANAVRTWARTDAAARAVVERLDRERTAYLERRCRELVDDPDAARDAAVAIHLLLVGSDYVVPPVPASQVLQVARRLFGRP